MGKGVQQDRTAGQEGWARVPAVCAAGSPHPPLQLGRGPQTPWCSPSVAWRKQSGGKQTGVPHSLALHARPSPHSHTTSFLYTESQNASLVWASGLPGGCVSLTLPSSCGNIPEPLL